MSDAYRDDLSDIRRELWLLYASLKEGKIDAELGETMVCTLDSLADLIRLEVERMHGADGKEDVREQPRNAS